MEFSVRRGSWDDVDAVLAVSQEASCALFGESDLTAEYLRTDWERPSFDPARHLFVAVENGAVLGHGTLEPGSGILVRVHPDHVDRAVEPALIAGVEEQARAEGIGFLTTIVPGEDVAACRAFTAAGFRTRREVWRMHVDLETEPEAASWPQGVSVRTYGDADAQAVHTLLDDAYLGWDDEYVPVSHEDWLHWMTSHDSFDPECWFLAEAASGGLVGVALDWKDGWVKDLAVRPEWRRRGLGEALLRHTFRELWRRGVRRVGLKVDSENGTGAPRLYERVGMTVDRRYPIYSKTL